MTVDPISLRRFDCYPADYLEGISDLDSDLQVAVYTVAFMAMYARRGPIADDAKWIAGMAKVRRAADCRRAIEELIAKGKLYRTGDGRLMNGRTRRELERGAQRVQNLRDNGRKGGRPARSTAPDPGAISSRSRRDHAPISSPTPTDIERNQSVKKPSGSDQPSTTNQQSTRKSKQQPSVAAREPDDADAAAAAFALWREAASAHKWPDPQFMNSTRRYAIDNLLAISGGLDGWRIALDKAGSAKFLLDAEGRIQRWFDIDWFIKADHFTRLMEGRYDDERAQAAGKPSALSETIASFRRARDR